MIRCEDRDNEEEVLLAVQKDGSNLQYASNRLKDNKEVVKTALKTSKVAFMFASKRLKDDLEFVCECSQKHWWVYYHTSDRLKKICDDFFKKNTTTEPEPFLAYQNALRKERKEELEFVLNMNKGKRNIVKI